MRKTLVLYWVLFSFAVNGWAQTHSSYQVPNIIQPVGTAAAIERYGNIPVDLSTGVPQIEIPFHTITSRKLSIPLSFSYHASGIKVNDISTPIGLGWVLKGLGVVTRTVLDWPDEREGDVGTIGGKAVYRTAAAYQTAVQNCPSTYIGESTLGQELFRDLKYRDNQSDRFSFSLPGGMSGTFRYDFINGQCVVAPFRPVKIDRQLTGTGPSTQLNAFTITDENGLVYNYAKASRSQFASCPDCYDGTSNISWYITSIRTHDGSDEIIYQYKTAENKFSLINYNHTYTFNIMVPGSECPGGLGSAYVPCHTRARSDQSVQTVTSFEPIPDKIISATTIVEFVYAEDRLDWQEGKHRMTGVRVYDKLSNQLIKEVSLNNNDYFGTVNYSDKRLKLNGLSFKGNDGVAVQNYNFTYEFGALPAYNSFNQDFWGYANGANNSGLAPLEFFTPAGSSGSHYYGVRKPNHNAAKACMLREIKYPTGGSTKFYYEGHFATGIFSASTPGIGDYIGGFRISRIENIAENGGIVTQSSYGYSQADFPHYIDASLFSYQQRYNWDYSLCSGGPGGGVPIRSVYQSSSFSPLSFSSGAPVIYRHVVVYDGTQSTNVGKTEYSYTTPDDPRPEPWSNAYGAYWFDNGAYEPKLLTKTIFKRENNTYLPIFKEANAYSTFRNTEYSTGAHMVKTVYDVAGTDAFYEHGYLFGSCCPSCAANQYIDGFSYMDSKVSEKVKLLTQSVQTHYKPDGAAGLSITSNYAYQNLQHLFVTEATVIGSAGKITKTTYQYPQDNNTDPFVGGMVYANLLTPVIQETNYEDGFILGSVKTYYKIIPLSMGLWVPDYIEAKAATQAPETRLRYNLYDTKGNLLDVSKENDLHETYVYGYNASLPVARIVSNYPNMTAMAMAHLTQSILDNPASDAALRSHLNVLRTNLPADVRITTYTHKPLIGITSETAPNGRTIFYEYDAFGRLKLTRDHNGNIIKTMDYHYKNQ